MYFSFKGSNNIVDLCSRFVFGFQVSCFQFFKRREKELE